MRLRITICLIVLSAIVLSGCSDVSETSNGDLVFLGTVEKLLNSPPKHKSVQHWIVRCRVDKIISGQFAGKTFAFRIHSPAKSGLEEGKQYRIKATRIETGYVVDQYQWRN